ncbi:hypothetical protein Q765_19610 [Flavobacterium rivuli WB 3.3-2 = DSM 21788]|uniref:Uncharacterized protein n=1 Tax=Flavobacterium rivuli WB 3.3-2 = DSM 21788 TaxID=1121895 RepID=A0A0A2M944_9FLAO|nr:hypothetical protein [Flavobacterium rivuli]KGO84820.1 hypothetical protein Q765_19610 [Flavobacterium rivuli WB 3.3-2 = DSM 21788]
MASVHPNYIKASDLLLINTVLTIPNVFLSPRNFATPLAISVLIAVIVFQIVIAIAIRNGVAWIKYLILVLFLIGLFEISTFVKIFLETPIIGVINIIQTLLQIAAIVLLFKIQSKNI